VQACRQRGEWFGWLVLVLGLGGWFWLVLVWWSVLRVESFFVGFGWLDLVGLVGWSYLGNQFYCLNLGWPEFCTPAKMT
jgi:hypothetical protein